MKLSALIVTLSSIAAFAQDAAQPEQPGALASFLPLILLFVVMWLFFIRPKQKEMKQMDEMRKQLKKGDKVMTAAGIIGTIASMEETSSRSVPAPLPSNLKRQPFSASSTTTRPPRSKKRSNHGYSPHQNLRL